MAVQGKKLILENSGLPMPPIVEVEGDDIKTSFEFDEQLALNSPFIGEKEDLLSAISIASHHWLGLIAYAVFSLLFAIFWWRIRICLHILSEKIDYRELVVQLNKLKNVLIGIFIFDFLSDLSMSTRQLALFKCYYPSDKFLEAFTVSHYSFEPWKFILPDLGGATLLVVAFGFYFVSRILTENIELQGQNKQLTDESSLVV